MCDKGDLFENPLLGKAFALAVLLGPFHYYFVPADDSDPFVAAMKSEGCLWEPSWWHRTVLALIVVAYAAIIHVARKRVMRPSGSASTSETVTRPSGPRESDMLEDRRGLFRRQLLDLDRDVAAF